MYVCIKAVTLADIDGVAHAILRSTLQITWRTGYNYSVFSGLASMIVTRLTSPKWLPVGPLITYACTRAFLERNTQRDRLVRIGGNPRC